MTYLLAIIYNLGIIYKGCYTTVTVPTIKDLKLLSYFISTMFYCTLFIPFLTHSHTSLNVGVICFAGPSFVLPVKGTCSLKY